MDIDILLGPVATDAHTRRLEEIAARIDQNRFPCTFSIYEGIGHFTVTPSLNGPSDWSWDMFRVYALETVVCALAASLCPAGEAFKLLQETADDQTQNTQTSS